MLREFSYRTCWCSVQSELSTLAWVDIQRAAERLLVCLRTYQALRTVRAWVSPFQIGLEWQLNFPIVALVLCSKFFNYRSLISRCTVIHDDEGKTNYRVFEFLRNVKVDSLWLVTHGWAGRTFQIKRYGDIAAGVPQLQSWIISGSYGQLTTRTRNRNHSAAVITPVICKQICWRDWSSSKFTNVRCTMWCCLVWKLYKRYVNALSPKKSILQIG